MVTRKNSIIATLGLICGFCLMLCIGIFPSFSTAFASEASAPTAPTVTTTSWTQVGKTAWQNGTKVALNVLVPFDYIETSEEDGTAEHPYLIENATDFGVFLYEMSESFETHTSKYFRIENNIDLGQYYLKSSVYTYYTANFGGVLDGYGKTLSNVFISNGSRSYTETGIFNTLTGTVKNLTINNAVVSSTVQSSVGVLAGKLSGVGSLDGIHITDSSVTATSADHVGGIVGYCVQSATGTIGITNSSVRNSTITGNTSVGGILGVYSPAVAAGDTSSFNLTSCLSYGNEINGAYKVGGIVGDFRGLYVGATQYATAAISKCYNYSTVEATDLCAGGIVGGIAMGTTTMSECTFVQFAISECGNAGGITAGNFAGGISGTVYCEALLTDNRKIENCFNQGTITAGNADSASLLGDLQYYNPIGAACYVASAITFRTADTYNDGDAKICDIKSSYNTGDLVLPESKSGLKTLGGIGAGSDTTEIYSLAQASNEHHKIYPLAGDSAYKTEYLMRTRVSATVDKLDSTYFEKTSGYPILTNIPQDWYFKPTVTVGRVYGATETSGSVWAGTPVTNIPAESVDLTYDTTATTDDGYNKLYYAEKEDTTSLTADSIIKTNTTVYVKYQVPVIISGNGNNVTVNKWQGAQLSLTDFNENATLQKTDNTITGLVGQALPLTVTASAIYTVAYTPITHSVTFMNGVAELKSANYNHNYSLQSIDFPTVTANAGYTVKWYDAQAEGNEYTAGSTVTQELTLYARQIANTNTPYSVKHYQESLTQSSGEDRIQQGGVWYELKDTQNPTGTTGTQTAAVVNVYNGFTPNNFSQSAISGNGNTIVNIYYTRNSYTVTLTSATGQTNSISKKHAAALASSDISTYAGCGTALGSKYFLNWFITGGTASANAFANGSIAIENAISLSVNAETIAVTAISVNSTAHKTAYYVGEALDVSNLTLAVSYNHSTQNTPSTISVASGMVSGFDTSTVGQGKSATITYQAKIATLNYSVSEQTFALTFMSDGAQYGNTVNLTEGTSISENFPSDNPTKSGSAWDTRYEFLGWYTASSGGEKITTQTMPATAFTVYAQFKTEYYISLKDTDNIILDTTNWYESGSNISPSALLDSIKTVKPNWNYTDYNYDFYLNYGSETQSKVSETGFSITSRTVIVYKSVVKTYSISFVMNGHGAQTNAISQGYGTTVSAPTNPAAVGYIFGGWFENSSFTGAEYSFTTMPSGGKTLYAKWTACDHSQNANPRSCTESTTCSVCLASMSALGHDLVHHDAQSPTCTEIGWEAYDTCSRCDYTTYEEISALGHSWGEWTSNDNGTHTHTCSRDASHTETADCSSFTDVVTAPTCTATGYTTRTCNDCEHVTTINITAKISHSLTAYPENAATHFAAGNSAYWHCSVCDKYFSDAGGVNEILLTDTIIAAIPHSYGTEWAKDGTGHWHECSCGSTKDFAEHTPGAAATENTPQTCTVCGYIITPATGHINHTPNTTQWYSDGTNHWHKCVGCEERLDITTHTGGTATCENKAHCGICGAEYGDFASHSYGAWTNATGTQHKRTCSVCGEIEYADHIWNEGVITTEPTHSQAGSRTFTCTVCGETRTEPVSALIEHTYNQEVVAAEYLKTAATCTQKAVYYKSCICGERGTETFEYGEYADHTLTPHAAVDATCDTAGNTAYWCCSVCGKYFSDSNGDNEITANSWITEQLGHSWGAWTVVTSATCTTAGQERRDCANCDHFETRVIEALGHNFVFDRTVAPDFIAQTDGYDICVCSHDSNHTEQRNPVKWETLGVSISVTNGTIGDAGESTIIVMQNGMVTVNAVEVEGKKFTGWQNAEGNIVSTNAEYVFYADKTMTLTAVYEDIPTKPNGLSGGAIAGITIACVFAVSLAVFAIFWFVIKKKSFADFVALFKKK